MNHNTLVIQPANPQGDDALMLLHEAALEARELYADLFDPQVPFPTNSPTPHRGIYLIAYLDNAPVASGAIRPIDEMTAEVRRMYVLKNARRFGIARSMLTALEQKAAELGYEIMRLETGNRQNVAMALYESYGFHRIPPFGEYQSDPTSVCFEKSIVRKANQ
jgi:putative acetyltransferase